MRIAVLYSGFLRSFEKEKPSHQKFSYDLGDVTCFIHTWSILGDSPMDGKYKYFKTDVAYHSLFGDVKNHISIEHLKDLQADRFKKFATDRNPQRVNSMFYSLQRSWELVQEDFDLYIKVRGDLNFSEALDPELITRSINEQSLVTPSFGGYSGLNDQFCYGPKSAMTGFCTVYQNLDLLSTQAPYMPESLVLQNVQNTGVPILKDPKVKYVINRGDGGVFDNSGFR